MEAPEPPPQDFPAGPVGKSPPATARDTGSVPGLRRSYMCCEAHVPQLPKPTLYSPHATTCREATAMESPGTMVREGPACRNQRKPGLQQRGPGTAGSIKTDWKGVPWRLSWERICLHSRRPQFDSWVGKIHWRRERPPTSVFLGLLPWCLSW